MNACQNQKRAARVDHELMLAWAERQLKNLESTISEYFSKHPDVLVTRYDGATGEQVVSFRKRYLPEEDIWSFQIGDVVHGLRVSLDYLAFRLVTTSPHTLKVDKIAFPICVDALRYPSLEGQRIGKQAPLGIRKAIERLQPYHGAKNLRAQPLAVLDQLENIHKHRRLLLAGVEVSSVHEIGTSDKIRMRFTGRRGIAVEDRAELYRYVVLDPTHTGTDVQIKVTSHVRIKEPGLAAGRPVVTVLKDIRDHIRTRVFPKFDKFL